MRDCVIGIELCEDLWAVNPPSGDMALNGATVLLNLSASNELLAKAEYRRDLVRMQGARCLAAYLYAGAGVGESTTDTVWSGHSLVTENGRILAETARFHFATQAAVADLDLMQLQHERLNNTTFGVQAPNSRYRSIRFALPGVEEAPPLELINRFIPRTPFVPGDPTQRAHHCEEIFHIQSLGLAKRLKHIGIERVTIGISGGLDSTLALLVTVKAFDRLGLDRAGIVAVTMPGFGTTQRTRAAMPSAWPSCLALRCASSRFTTRSNSTSPTSAIRKISTMSPMKTPRRASARRSSWTSAIRSAA